MSVEKKLEVVAADGEVVAALENDGLVHEAPAIVGCQTPSGSRESGRLERERQDEITGVLRERGTGCKPDQLTRSRFRIMLPVGRARVAGT